MRTVSFSDRLRYAFDKSMARGPIALIGWLALISLAIIFLAALVVSLFGVEQPKGEKLNPIEAAWVSLMHALDSGAVGGAEGWEFRGVMFVVTLAGLFLVGSLIGILSSGIESKLDELRKGRSQVLEEGHTLILGWSPALFPIVSELCIAGANEKKPRIVILAPRDKVEMEDELRDKVGATGRTQIICRTGSPIDLRDLEIGSPRQARSIIVLAPEEGDADSQVIKTILALTNNPTRKEGAYHIVSQLHDPKNLEVARMVGGDEVQLVLTDDLISRITVQAARQSGISAVYTDLLDYEGDEIYFQHEPKLEGKTFGDSLGMYESAAPIGLRLSDGRVMVHPPMDTVIGRSDEIIAVAEDDDRIVLSPAPLAPIDESAISNLQPSAPLPERTLILGWNRRGAGILSELSAYVAPGSLTTIAALPEALAEVPEVAEAEHAAGERQPIEFKPCDTSDRASLESLEVPTYEHVIVLAYSDLMGAEEADAKTLITLLHLRQIEQRAQRESGVDFSIVSEMLDSNNRDLAQVTRADDFIVSDRLVSLVLAQVSQNKYLNAVLEDIFDAEGSEIYLKPANEYVLPERPVSFYTVVEAARRKGEIAIGYRLKSRADDPQKAYGVVLNPKKSEAVSLSEEDRVIVLAQE